MWWPSVCTVVLEDFMLIEWRLLLQDMLLWKPHGSETGVVTIMICSNSYVRPICPFNQFFESSDHPWGTRNWSTASLASQKPKWVGPKWWSVMRSACPIWPPNLPNIIKNQRKAVWVCTAETTDSIHNFVQNIKGNGHLLFLCYILSLVAIFAVISARFVWEKISASSALSQLAFRCALFFFYVTNAPLCTEFLY